MARIADWLANKAEIPLEPDEKEILTKWVSKSVYIGFPVATIAALAPRVLIHKRVKRSGTAFFLLSALTGTAALFVTALYCSSKFGEDILASDTQMGEQARISLDEHARCRYIMAGGDPSYYKPMEFKVNRRVVEHDQSHHHSSSQ